MKKTWNWYRISSLAICLAFILALVVAVIPAPALAKDKLVPITEVDEDATYTAYARGGRIFITLDKFSAKHVFKVKVREPAKVKAWTTLGTVKVVKKTKVTAVFAVPASLKKSMYIGVCLKEQTTDHLVCLNVVNQP